MLYDVAIIGAGVVGAAIARELARYELRVVLLEAGSDVGAGTSKASTAIWHTGFDAKPGTVEARLLRRGYTLLEEFMPLAGIPYERLGGLLIAWTPEQLDALPVLLTQAHQNGVIDTRLVSAAEIYQREPHLGPGVLGGIFVPGEGILCTFTLPLAYATQAVCNGVTLRLNFRVTRITPQNLSGSLRRLPDATDHPVSAYLLESDDSSISCRYLVNAAGLYADEVDRLMGHQRFTVTPRRGQLIIFDKLARSLVNHVLLPVPTAKTKGVLVSPTVYGNILLGPTAEDLADKAANGVTAQGLQGLLEKGRVLIPSLLHEEITATYAGLRAATEQSDYQIHLNGDERYVCVGGIRSTGVSAALGIAEYVVGLLAEAGLPLQPKPEFLPIQMPYIGEVGVRPYQSAAHIAANPAYGQIVCHCERVTLGEIEDAVGAPIPARTLDGLRRRTRVLQGRCQGFNCQATVLALLARATGQNPASLTRLEPAHAA